MLKWAYESEKRPETATASTLESRMAVVRAASPKSPARTVRASWKWGGFVIINREGVLAEGITAAEFFVGRKHTVTGGDGDEDRLDGDANGYWNVRVEKFVWK